ncbi:Rcb2.42 [Pisolithus orientalis]|uniref:Rcb2.42 n=1 Tax=Pisolithus orientalis TaxID=936130 RepID=UPI0022241CF4|nr:Rcb2.42 [Pisolithus orientalis]KAI5992351.1 Rcb2.42 [Pisolithus orientalis]
MSTIYSLHSVMRAELSVGAFIAAGLVLVPLPWHWRARNVAMLSTIVWLLVSNIIYAVDAIIWAGNVADSAPVWCDITTKLQVGTNMALPACCLCICIHLERIASVRQVRTSHSDRIRRKIFDATLCWMIPIVYMALHYVVQGHRFDIIEDFGCRPTVYVSVPAIFLIWVPPITAALATFGFSAVAVRHFFRRRLMFAKHLQNSNSGLTTSRYFRLMSMAVVQMFWSLLIMSFNVWFSCQNGLRPWISWDNVHTGFSQIAYFPTVLIPSSTLIWTYILWWALPASSVIFFVFFSFGHDAMNEYRECFSWVRRAVFSRIPEEQLKNLSLPRGGHGCQSLATPQKLRMQFQCNRRTFTGCSEKESTAYDRDSVGKDTVELSPDSPTDGIHFSTPPLSFHLSSPGKHDHDQLAFA